MNNNLLQECILHQIHINHKLKLKIIKLKYINNLKNDQILSLNKKYCG